MDTLLLSRIQFALNISFHILFPAITIGLSWVLFYFRLRYTLTRDSAWEYAYYFWVKVFGLTFALGIVSGVTMSFQFGTNWPGFIERAGNIAGPLLGYEVLTAFFLEATFLGVMLFAKDRVSNVMHLISAGMVAVGTSLSAFWILSLNSWMQTPRGYRIVDGEFFAVDWAEIIFNPSFPYRLTHMMIASLLTTAFLIGGVSAWRMRRKVDGPATLLVLRTGVFTAALLTPLQAVVGDLHGLNTLEHQPAKIAAIEALWETQRGAPLVLFAMPDGQRAGNRATLEIPGLASLILRHDLDGEVRGLNEFGENHPPVLPVFVSFRVMVGIWLLMTVTAWWTAWPLVRGRRPPPAGLRALSWMTFSGWVAILAGWYVSEIGRQPWIISGLLDVEDVVAPHPPANVAVTLAAYSALYAFLLGAYVLALRHMATKPAASLRLLGPQRSPLPSRAP